MKPTRNSSRAPLNSALPILGSKRRPTRLSRASGTTLRSGRSTTTTQGRTEVETTAAMNQDSAPVSGSSQSTAASVTLRKSSSDGQRRSPRSQAAAGVARPAGATIRILTTARA
jgi:hypothetical protein